MGKDGGLWRCLEMQMYKIKNKIFNNYGGCWWKVVEVSKMMVVVVMVLWVTDVILLTFKVNTPFVSKIVPSK